MVGQAPSSITWTSFVTDMLPRTTGYKGQNILEFWSAVSLVTGTLTLNAVLLADDCSQFLAANGDDSQVVREGCGGEHVNCVPE